MLAGDEPSRLFIGRTMDTACQSWQTIVLLVLPPIRSNSCRIRFPFCANYMFFSHGCVHVRWWSTENVNVCVISVIRLRVAFQKMINKRVTAKCTVHAREQNILLVQHSNCDCSGATPTRPTSHRPTTCQPTE